MIYTVTLNPALDFIIHLDHFTMGGVNRSARDAITHGGKGSNVSVMLKRLGIESVALGFLAGFTGREIQALLEADGCTTDFCWVEDGYSRINVKLKLEGETEINARGPRIEAAHFQALLEKLDSLEDGDILVLAGSIPPGFPTDAYPQMMGRVGKKDIRVVVDATGETLRGVLPLGPFLVKPNHLELGDLFGKALHTTDEVVRHARILQEEGARNVLVSRGADGAVLVGADGLLLQASPPQGEVISTTGSGDSMVAGFLAGLHETGTLEGAFYTGLAAGSASAFCPHLAGGEDILALRRKWFPSVGG